ncbi:MAG: hypothetical protein NTW87_30010 [Planctomycetota bacterium]|nr:hypothetical protein [Planctomycetota bacterium]
MTLTIQKLDDQTPKGLTTGFRLLLHCVSSDGKPFKLSAAILVSKPVIEKSIPLPNIVIAALERWGLEECAREMFVDTRRLDLAAVPLVETVFPCTVTLGGMDLLNQKSLAKLTAAS